MDNGNNVATKEDLGNLRSDLSQQIEASEARLADRLERAVTTILTGFHTHAKRNNTRVTSLESRLAQVEDRLLEIEGQLGKPPTA